MGMIAETRALRIIKIIGKKRERNIKHDQEVTAMFEARGWTVLRIWECELKTKNTKALLERFQIALNDEQLSKTNL